jgi:phosphoribosylformylglycinamidine (FGAM) synthase-like enzyme
VVSVLWDNAGAARFDDDHYYVITGETHNSPSNMEAYGGAITGIVGVYRDPMGTGKGSKLIMGSYGYCMGPRDYDGTLTRGCIPAACWTASSKGSGTAATRAAFPPPSARSPSSRLHGQVPGVRYRAGPHAGHRAGRTLRKRKPSSPGDLIVMCGGRVGKDGIHGVTASSETFPKTRRPVMCRSATPTPRKRCMISCWRPATRG